MNNKGSIIFIILLICLFISSCSTDLKEQNSELNDQISELKNENGELIRKIAELENKNKDLSEEKELHKIEKRKFGEHTELLENKIYRLSMNESSISRKLNSQHQYLNSLSKEDYFNSNYIIIPVYTANIDTYKRETEYYIIIPKKILLEEKLKVMADILTKSFANLPIEVMRIDNKEGKLIAVINLKENSESNATWNTLYFQGSCGGTVISTTLIETFLQRDYEGEWIDGVKFLYHGGDVQFEHVADLEKINYR